MTAPQNLLQRAAKAAIKEHRSVRKAAEALGLDHTLLYRIATGARQNVSAHTAAKLGLQAQWRAIA